MIIVSSKIEYTTENHQSDVLIIGGGLAGAVAAIKARENGADVIVLEKANTYRSGDAGSGLDHIYSYVPPVHEKVGYTKELMKSDMLQCGLLGLGIGFREIPDHFVDVSYERILELEKLGINFRYDDSHLEEGFRLVPQFHSIPTSFHFEGRDVKVKLTERMKELGVKIINHAEVVEILKDGNGAAAGAAAVSTREDKIYVVSAKTTILSTSNGAGHLVRNVNPHNYFEGTSGSNSGFGISLALNAGAEVTNLEFSINNGGLTFPGFKFTAGAPGGTWWPAARVVDDEGNVVVERVTDYDINEPDYLNKNVDQMAKYAVQKVSMDKLMESGKQLYVDLADATDEEVEYIKWSMSNEGMCWLYLRNLEYRNIDLRDVKIPYKLLRRVMIHGESTGVLTNAKTETTLPDLYVAGDAMGGGGMQCAPGAVVYGHEAGVQAAKRAAEKESAGEVNKQQVDKILDRVIEIREEGGSHWRTVLSRLQEIVGLFGVFPLTDSKINSALEELKQLRENAPLHAEDPHELARSFDVLSLIDTAEAVFTAAYLRKDNLGPFKRYADSDDRTYGERVAAKDGKLPSQEIYGLYRDDDGIIRHNTHITNQEGA